MQQLTVEKIQEDLEALLERQVGTQINPIGMSVAMEACRVAGVSRDRNSELYQEYPERMRQTTHW